MYIPTCSYLCTSCPKPNLTCYIHPVYLNQCYMSHPARLFSFIFFSSYFFYALHVLPITHYQLPTYLLTVGSDDRRPLLHQCHFHLALEAEARPLREGHEVGGPAWLRPPVRELWRGRGGELQGVLAGRGRDVECGFREAGWVVG